MRVNICAEDSSRRDLVKVAQYPAAAGLGYDAKRGVRPASLESFRGYGRSKHSVPGLAVASLSEAR